jgi:pyruvate dehydrogenase E2 component (dihydrolipoamide acetyltransferase)
VPRRGRRERSAGSSDRCSTPDARAPWISVTWVEECDFTGVQLKLLLPLVLKAVAESLREFPELNARIEGNELVYLDRYDLGIAVQTEQGLVVPVVHGADRLSLEELDAEVTRLAEAAHEGKLEPGELRGGTFTVTSAGKAAGLFVTPLINHPEVAILGIHRIADRPFVRDGEVVVRRMGNVSVTFDHRVIDGKRAAEFGLAVIARLES